MSKRQNRQIFKTNVPFLKIFFLEELKIQNSIEEKKNANIILFYRIESNAKK